MTKRLTIYLLAFLTFWMSTWMLTDIHDVVTTKTDTIQLAHPVFLSQHTQSITDNHDLQNNQHHCGVCSYDHGGHMEQIQAVLSFITERIPSQNMISHPLHSGFWYSRNILPKLRPPIA